MFQWLARGTLAPLSCIQILCQYTPSKQPRRAGRLPAPHALRDPSPQCREEMVLSSLQSHHTWGCCFLESVTKSCHLQPTAQGSPLSTSAPEPFGQLKCRGDVHALLHFTAGSHQKPSLCMGKSHPKAPAPPCSHLNVTSVIYNQASRLEFVNSAFVNVSPRNVNDLHAWPEDFRSKIAHLEHQDSHWFTFPASRQQSSLVFDQLIVFFKWVLSTCHVSAGH